MTSLEKAINLGCLFLTLKPKYIYIYINKCTTFCCMYWYVSIYSEDCFWPQYMYPKLSSFNGYRWCPLGKLSHLRLEQLSTVHYFLYSITQRDTLTLDNILKFIWSCHKYLQHAYECVTWHQIMYVRNTPIWHRIFVWSVLPYALWGCIDGLLANFPNNWYNK